jgi:hypothetical protein
MDIPFDVLAAWFSKPIDSDTLVRKDNVLD